METPQTQLHGSLVEVQGLGVLLLGPSAIGKSECLLELVRRGHRMVADDVVRLRPARSGTRLVGFAPDTIRHHIEVRGLGLLSVPDLFGPEATLDECEVGFVCRFERWKSGLDFERIGLERPQAEWIGISVPMAVLPAHAACDLATLVEVAVRDWRLREGGVNAARRLDERLRRRAREEDGSSQGAADVGAAGEEGAAR